MNCTVTQRVVALVDMDCFYCQVEARLNPSLKGKPMAVVQYNQWKGGGIIAVNYEARDRGVSRHMRGDEAKLKCPEIELVRVPTIRGKADLSKYREAGDEVAKVFSEFSDCVQRASIDEAYLDLTKATQECIKHESESSVTTDDLPNTFIVGFSNSKNNNEDEREAGLQEWLNHVESEKTSLSSDYMLAVAGKIVEKMRSEILSKTGFHCSAGISHNKILAKLTAGLHKPKRQTILPQDSIPELYETLPIYKVRNLGGKLGKVVSDKLSIQYMSELYRFSLQDLQKKFDEKTSLWLYNIARGVDNDPVTPRLRPESIGCCKNFTGNNQLRKKSLVEHWLKELATEISDRLYKDFEKSKRKAKLLTVSFSQENAMSRCGPLNSYEVSRIVRDAMDMLKKFNTGSSSEDVWEPPIKYLGLSASKFSEEISSIEKFFTVNQKQDSSNDKDATVESSNQSNDSEKLTQLPSTSAKTSSKVFERKNKTPKSKKQTQSSFFMKFLQQKKDIPRPIESKEPEKDEVEVSIPENVEPKENGVEKDEESGEENWVSLTEVFPDLNEVDEEVVEILPGALQKKYKERVSCNGDNTEQNQTSEERKVTPTEVCGECGKDVPIDEILEHLDHHTALKLHSELNKPNVVNGTALKHKSNIKDSEPQSKRKKKGSVSPAKKVRSITSFFDRVPKP